MSKANPYVSGRRVIFPSRFGDPMVLGHFSCHWAAVAALVRLHQPDFKSLSGDSRADLKEEKELTKRLKAAKEPRADGRGRYERVK